MSKKVIPFHLKEHLERQVVRNSRGHEAILKLLDSVSESELRNFLEVYEDKLRDTFLDSNTKTDLTDLDKVLNNLKPKQDSDDNKFSKLLAKVANVAKEDD